MRASFELNADNVRFIGSREGATMKEGEPMAGPAAQEEDEIPF
jgi:hypothetical protein